MHDITVHHLEKSRSHRILWMLEELELPYELREYARHPQTMRAPPELREIHPLGKAPVVTIGDLVLAESGAVIEHLADQEGRLRPEPGTPEHRRYRYWLHYAEGSLMPPLLVSLILSRLTGPPVPFFIRPISRALVGKVNEAYTDPELTRHFAFIEDALTEHEWFAGDAFTAADIQMSYPVEAGVARAGLSSPRTLAWLDRIRQRPAWRRAVERGGEPSLRGASDE